MEQLNERLASLRRRAGYSQEGLAERLGISRQAVSKWESAQSQPDVARLVQLSELYEVSLDQLIKGTPAPSPARPGAARQTPGEAEICRGCPWREVQRTVDEAIRARPGHWEYEYRSRRTLWGVPLVHIHLARNRLNVQAHGVLAVGNRASGVVSVGLFSRGLLSFGLCSLGAVSLGVLSVGLVALGNAAVGALALGNVAVGLVAFGNIAAGGLLAAGNLVKGRVAIGNAGSGSVAQVIIGDGMASEAQKAAAGAVLLQHCSWLPGWAVRMLLAML